VLTDAKGRVAVGAGRVSSPGGAVEIQSVDADAQESGKAATWTGAGDASVAIAGPAADFVRQTNGDMALSLRFRVDRPPEAPVGLDLQCDGKTCASLDVSRLIGAAPVGQWRSVRIKLACFRGQGVDLSKVTAPLVLHTAGRFGLSFADAELVANSGGAVCP
jgi:beta-glucosidase